MDVFGTAFLPNIAYFQHLLAAQSPVIDLGEYFIKQTLRNRALILSPNGIIPVIIPIHKTECKTVVTTQVSYAEDWQIKHLRAFRACYKSSPYYEHYQKEFEELLMEKQPLLYQYNMNLFTWLLKELDIDTEIEYSNDYLETGIQKDFRNVDFSLSTQQLFIREYKQVFSYKSEFVPNLSVIDLLFNKGPECLPYLK